MKRWEKIRQQVIKRDKACQSCFRIKNRMVVHHKDFSGDLSNHKYSNNNLSNLVLYCNSCHAKMHWKIAKEKGSLVLNKIDVVNHDWIEHKEKTLDRFMFAQDEWLFKKL